MYAVGPDLQSCIHVTFGLKHKTLQAKHVKLCPELPSLHKKLPSLREKLPCFAKNMSAQSTTISVRFVACYPAWKSNESTPLTRRNPPGIIHKQPFITVLCL